MNMGAYDITVRELLLFLAMFAYLSLIHIKISIHPLAMTFGSCW